MSTYKKWTDGDAEYEEYTYTGNGNDKDFDDEDFDDEDFSRGNTFESGFGGQRNTTTNRGGGANKKKGWFDDDSEFGDDEDWEGGFKSVVHNDPHFGYNFEDKPHDHDCGPNHHFNHDEAINNANQLNESELNEQADWGLNLYDQMLDATSPDAEYGQILNTQKGN